MGFPDCHSRRPSPDTDPRPICLHPRVHANGQRVTAEICAMCSYWRQPVPDKFRTLESVLRRDWRPRTVAVVIPCHNYGHFLGESVESVLRQSRVADEILIVDDASTDDTPDVASLLGDQGVRYLRVGFEHSQRARRAGFLATKSDVVCFLDADDCLAPEYLESGMAQFTESTVGVVYSDVEFFGLQAGRSDYPAAFDRGLLSRMNYVHSGSLVLREALNLARGLEIETDDRFVLQDWLLWRRVLDHGWKARKQSGLYRYRKHNLSMTASWQHWQDNPVEYFQRAALAYERVTLFVPLSGRRRLWPMLADYLDHQAWPHQQTKLILLDTSQDAEFSQNVRRWMAGCDYTDVRHLCEHVGEAGLADQPRHEAAPEVSQAMARIYACLSRELATDYVWILEDDVFPPPDACERLLRGFDRRTASVSGCYRSRFADAWVVWGHDQHMLSKRGDGLEPIGGNGFGCVILRGEIVRKAVFTATLDSTAYDNAFYCRLPSTGLEARVDWSVECQHAADRESRQGSIAP